MSYLNYYHVNQNSECMTCNKLLIKNNNSCYNNINQFMMINNNVVSLSVVTVHIAVSIVVLVYRVPHDG